MEENPSVNPALEFALQALRERAESVVRAAEEASSKANSESGFAFNAKQNAEDHARAIAQVRGAVDADFTWLTTTKKNAEELAQAITSFRNASENDSRISSEMRSSAEKDASTTKAVSDRISALASTIEKVQSDVTSTQEKVTAEAASVTIAKANAEVSAGAIQSVQAQISETASKATTDAASIAKSEAEAKNLYASMAQITTLAKTTHERVTGYQTQLENLIAEFNSLHVKIEGLLPNATSAGLASAFRNQKGRFQGPQRNWLIMFVVTIVLLLASGLVGLPGFWPTTQMGGSQDSWDAILRHLVTRLPLVAPLVWLAIYAGRHYTLALRVEEEYAFKEAVSTAFEGYKREMANISTGSDGSSPPIITLCESVLRALAQRPGRIYEGHHDDITPFTPLAKAVGDAAAGVVNAAKKNDSYGISEEKMYLSRHLFAIRLRSIMFLRNESDLYDPRVLACNRPFCRLLNSINS